MKPGLTDLISMRRQWRNFHQSQDRESADRIFENAGLMDKSIDLAPLPIFLRGKLSEFGREWEGALALAASREGFIFYQAELQLEIAAVQPFYTWVEKRLESVHPVAGTPLFFESQGPHPLHEGVWSSHFYFTLRAGISPDTLGFLSAPGIHGAPKFMRIT